MGPDDLRHTTVRWRCGVPGLAQEPIIKSPEKREFRPIASLDLPLKCECDVSLASK